MGADLSPAFISRAALSTVVLLWLTSPCPPQPVCLTESICKKPTMSPQVQQAPWKQCEQRAVKAGPCQRSCRAPGGELGSRQGTRVPCLPRRTHSLCPGLHSLISSLKLVLCSQQELSSAFVKSAQQSQEKRRHPQAREWLQVTFLSILGHFWIMTCFLQAFHFLPQAPSNFRIHHHSAQATIREYYSKSTGKSKALSSSQAACAPALHETLRGISHADTKHQTALLFLKPNSNSTTRVCWI